jgi:hypothetical protein
VFDAGPKRNGGAAKVSPAARVNNCWVTRPMARSGLTKQTARREKGWPLAGFGLAAAGERATGGVAGWPAQVGSTRARARRRRSGSLSLDEETRGRMCVHVRMWVCGAAWVRERTGARQRRLAGWPVVAARATVPSTGETPRVLR